MEIKFKEVASGIVEARAVIKLESGLTINEVTILGRGGDIEVELPQKSFKAKTGFLHNIDIITFDSEDEKNLFLINVKNAFLDWRKRQKKVRIFDS